MNRGSLIVISAPSGAGKSTLIREISQCLKGLTYSISVTTRCPRVGEKEGKDYFFITHTEFSKRKNAGEFLEYAKVHGQWYGTPKRYINQKLAKGEVVLLDIDVQGGRQVKKIYAEAVLVFVAPPALKDLEARLRGRKQDPEHSILQRLSAVRRECRSAQHYDYLVVNEKISHALEQLRCIIIAERSRMRYFKSFLKAQY